MFALLFVFLYSNKNKLGCFFNFNVKLRLIRISGKHQRKKY